ncbi:MAG: hypothetical protein AMXMBFR17_30510 [Candidatus Jettenia caeni]|nr:MAG: hypothetical protein JETCAE04_32180 [Candidatus Jettenia caeni]
MRTSFLRAGTRVLYVNGPIMIKKTKSAMPDTIIILFIGFNLIKLHLRIVSILLRDK